MSSVPVESGEFIRSLERGLAVVRVFGADAPSLTLSDVAHRAGLTRATARRILHTLNTLGYVDFDGKFFVLTPKVLDLGYAYLSSLQVAEIAQPTMEALSDEVHESVSMALLDGDDIVYVARVPTKRIMAISLGLGSRLPAHCTSLGRALLAGLPEPALSSYLDRVTLTPRTSRTIVDCGEFRLALDEVRTRGWALLDQELEEGVRSIAAPVHDRMGRVVAAVNIGTHVSRVSLGQLRNELVPRLLAACRQIDAQLAKR